MLLQLDLSFARAPGKHTHIYSRDGNVKHWFLNEFGINEYYEEYCDWRQLDAWLPIFRYQGSPLMLGKHLLLSNKYDKKKEFGFWNPELSGTTRFHFPRESRKDLEYHDIFKIAEKHGLKIIFFTPPSPKNFHSPKPHIIDSLFKANNIKTQEHLFFSNWQEYNFRDQAHLTFESAVRFTSALGDSLLLLDWIPQDNPLEQP